MLKSLEVSVDQQGDSLIVSIWAKGNTGVANDELHNLFYSRWKSTPFIDLIDSINNNQKIPTILDEEKINHIIFDLTKISYIWSSWLLPFLKANRFLSEKNPKEKVVLLNPNDRIENVVLLSKLDTIFDIQKESLVDLLKTLQSKGE